MLHVQILLNCDWWANLFVLLSLDHLILKMKFHDTSMYVSIQLNRVYLFPCLLKKKIKRKEKSSHKKNEKKNLSIYLRMTIPLHLIKRKNKIKISSLHFKESCPALKKKKEGGEGGEGRRKETIPSFHFRRNYLPL